MSGRPQTPVSELSFVAVRKLKQQFNSGAKIVSALRKALEYKFGEEMAVEEVAHVVDWLLSEGVISIW